MSAAGITNVPNTFNVPNWHVDSIMHLLTSDEYKVLNFITRHILGWQKECLERRRRISFKMFSDGYEDHSGHRYHGTGLGESAIRNALKELVKYGALLALATDEGKPDISNDGQLWELPASPKIDITGLEQRLAEQQTINKKRTRKARKAKAEKVGVVLSHNTTSAEEGGIVAQYQGGIVAQYQGGIVAQGESNTTKPTKPFAAPPPQPDSDHAILSGTSPDAGAGENLSPEVEETAEPVKVKPVKAKTPRKRKLTDEQVKERGQIFELVCKYSFGKAYQDINGSIGFASKIAQKVHLAKATPETLEAGYKHFAAKHPQADRLKDVDKILHYIEEARAANAPKPTPDPACQKCGVTGRWVDKSNPRWHEVKDCECKAVRNGG